MLFDHILISLFLLYIKFKFDILCHSIYILFEKKGSSWKRENNFSIRDFYQEKWREFDWLDWRVVFLVRIFLAANLEIATIL